MIFIMIMKKFQPKCRPIFKALYTQEKNSIEFHFISSAAHLPRFAVVGFFAALPRASPPNRILVLPLSMNSAEDLTFLQRGIADMLSTRLTFEDSVTVLDRKPPQRRSRGFRPRESADRR